MAKRKTRKRRLKRRLRSCAPRVRRAAEEFCRKVSRGNKLLLKSCVKNTAEQLAKICGGR